MNPDDWAVAVAQQAAAGIYSQHMRTVNQHHPYPQHQQPSMPPGAQYPGSSHGSTQHHYPHQSFTNHNRTNQQQAATIQSSSSSTSHMAAHYGANCSQQQQKPQHQQQSQQHQHHHQQQSALASKQQHLAKPSQAATPAPTSMKANSFAAGPMSAGSHSASSSWFYDSRQQSEINNTSTLAGSSRTSRAPTIEHFGGNMYDPSCAIASGITSAYPTENIASNYSSCANDRPEKRQMDNGSNNYGASIMSTYGYHGGAHPSMLKGSVNGDARTNGTNTSWPATGAANSQMNSCVNPSSASSCLMRDPNGSMFPNGKTSSTSSSRHSSHAYQQQEAAAAATSSRGTSSDPYGGYYPSGYHPGVSHPPPAPSAPPSQHYQHHSANVYSKCYKDPMNDPATYHKMMQSQYFPSSCSGQNSFGAFGAKFAAAAAAVTDPYASYLFAQECAYQRQKQQHYQQQQQQHQQQQHHQQQHYASNSNFPSDCAMPTSGSSFDPRVLQSLKETADADDLYAPISYMNYHRQQQQQANRSYSSTSASAAKANHLMVGDNFVDSAPSKPTTSKRGRKKATTTTAKASNSRAAAVATPAPNRMSNFTEYLIHQSSVDYGLPNGSCVLGNVGASAGAANTGSRCSSVASNVGASGPLSHSMMSSTGASESFPYGSYSPATTNLSSHSPLYQSQPAAVGLGRSSNSSHSSLSNGNNSGNSNNSCALSNSAPNVDYLNYGTPSSAPPATTNLFPTTQTPTPIPGYPTPPSSVGHSNGSNSRCNSNEELSPYSNTSMSSSIGSQPPANGASVPPGSYGSNSYKSPSNVSMGSNPQISPKQQSISEQPQQPSQQPVVDNFQFSNSASCMMPNNSQQQQQQNFAVAQHYQDHSISNADYSSQEANYQDYSDPQQHYHHHHHYPTDLPSCAQKQKQQQKSSSVGDNLIKVMEVMPFGVAVQGGEEEMEEDDEEEEEDDESENVNNGMHQRYNLNFDSVIQPIESTNNSQGGDINDHKTSTNGYQMSEEVMTYGNDQQQQQSQQQLESLEYQHQTELIEAGVEPSLDKHQETEELLEDAVTLVAANTARDAYLSDLAPLMNDNSQIALMESTFNVPQLPPMPPPTQQQQPTSITTEVGPSCDDHILSPVDDHQKDLDIINEEISKINKNLYEQDDDDDDDLKLGDDDDVIGVSSSNYANTTTTTMTKVPLSIVPTPVAPPPPAVVVDDVESQIKDVDDFLETNFKNENLIMNDSVHGNDEHKMDFMEAPSNMMATSSYSTNNMTSLTTDTTTSLIRLDDEMLVPKSENNSPDVCPMKSVKPAEANNNTSDESHRPTISMNFEGNSEGDKSQPIITTGSNAKTTTSTMTTCPLPVILPSVTTSTSPTIAKPPKAKAPRVRKPADSKSNDEKAKASGKRKTPTPPPPPPPPMPTIVIKPIEPTKPKPKRSKKAETLDAVTTTTTTTATPTKPSKPKTTTSATTPSACSSSSSLPPPPPSILFDTKQIPALFSALPVLNETRFDDKGGSIKQTLCPHGHITTITTKPNRKRAIAPVAEPKCKKPKVEPSPTLKIKTEFPSIDLGFQTLADKKENVAIKTETSILTSPPSSTSKSKPKSKPNVAETVVNGTPTKSRSRTKKPTVSPPSLPLPQPSLPLLPLTPTPQVSGTSPVLQPVTISTLATTSALPPQATLVSTNAVTKPQPQVPPPPPPLAITISPVSSQPTMTLISPKPLVSMSSNNNNPSTIQLASPNLLTSAPNRSTVGRGGLEHAITITTTTSGAPGPTTPNSLTPTPGGATTLIVPHHHHHQGPNPYQISPLSNAVLISIQPANGHVPSLATGPQFITLNHQPNGTGSLAASNTTTTTTSTIASNSSAAARRRSQDKKLTTVREGLMRTGDFVVPEEEAHLEWPVIWRIEGKSLLQRFESSDQNGTRVYVNTSSVSTICTACRG